jgi:serine/threonine protein kinase
LVARILRPPPGLPQSFGRYRVAAVLGRGAMGVVYKAHDPLLDRDVAVKLIKTDLLDAGERSEYLERFMREAQAAARCTHRGIVAVYDFSENDGSPFIVMEFVEGPDLRYVMRTNGSQVPEQAIPVMLQILDALGHAHRLGIVHRDIKPPNILMRRPDEVKITDFGIARLGTGQATQAGVVIGTPRYMAPEQARGEAVDLRADLFSAAAVFWEMLTGKPAFAGDSQAAIISQVMFGDPQAPIAASASAHSALYGTLRRALAKSPVDRFASAADFVTALQRAATAGARSEDDHTVVQIAASRIDATVIDRAERELATFIGPLAKVLVRQAALSASSAGDLYQTLGAKISNEADRTSFMRQAEAKPATDHSGPTLGGTRPGAASGSFTPPAGVLVPPEVQAAAQTALTLILGPIAKVLVRQALARSRSTDEFFDLLAGHVTRDDTRAEFRRQLRKYRDPRS